MFLLQAFVPIGYMPASWAEEGTLVKLCPAGVSDEVMAILHSNHGQHSNHDKHNNHDQHATASPAQQHAHHNHIAMHGDDHNNSQHGQQTDTNASTDHSSSHDNNSWSQCPYGAASSGNDIALVALTFSVISEKPIAFQQALIEQTVVASLRRKQLQRAPPFRNI